MNFLFNLLIKATLPLFPKLFVKIIAKNYVAGTTNDEVIRAIKKVNLNGSSATIDILGEHTKDENKAIKIKNEYSKLYKIINQKNLD